MSAASSPVLDGGAVRAWLDEVVRPRLDEAAVRLRARLPGLPIHVTGGDVGALTTFQGHGVSLATVVSTAEDASLALEVTGAYLTTTPRVFADVCWGHPYGTSEAELVGDGASSDCWPLATADLLARVEGELPRMVEAFALAAERGRPSDHPAPREPEPEPERKP